MVERTPDWLHLSENERVVWTRRPHVIWLVLGIIEGVIVALVAFTIGFWGLSNGWLFVGVPAFLVAAAGTAFVGYRFAHWVNTRYVITTEELYEKRGVISRDVTQFRLDRIQNTTMQQSVLGRVFGYGDLTVYTAGSGDPELTFSQVPDPSEASAALSNQLGSVSSKERVDPT